MNLIPAWLKRYFTRKKFDIPHIPNEGMKEIYTDSKGNKFYALNNPANLHATRALPAWVFARDSEYSMTKERRIAAYEKINECVNKKDLASIAKIVGVMEAAEQLYCEPEILLNLATCYTFLNDEKNDSYKDFIQEQKRDIWNSDSEAKSFFLQWSLQYTAKYSASLKLNVQEYLGKVKPILDQINYQIPVKQSQSKSSSSLKTSTS